MIIKKRGFLMFFFIIRGKKSEIFVKKIWKCVLYMKILKDIFIKKNIFFLIDEDCLFGFRLIFL